MVTPEVARPERVGPAKLTVRLLLGAVISAAVTCFVVGAVIGKWSVVGIGGALLLAAYAAGVVNVLRNGSDTADRKPDPVRLTALAKIESRRATGGDSGDVPVEFDLTVQPEDGPAYRVTCSQTINLVDVPDYPPGRVMVAEYRSGRPWQVTLVAAPAPGPAARAAGAAIDTAPESTRLATPDLGLPSCAAAFAGTAIGTAVILVIFRADLF